MSKCNQSGQSCQHRVNLPSSNPSDTTPITSEVVGVGGAEPLPCLYSNNANEKWNYVRKVAHCVRENIERMCREVGLDNLGFLTLTFPDNVTCFKEAYKRFNSFRAGYLSKCSWVTDYFLVKERQSRGAWHYHLLVNSPYNLRSGFDWSEYDNDIYRSANENLRAIWAELRSVLPKYNFGRHELTPIRTNAEGISSYMAKYLIKGFGNRLPGDKGMRLFSCSRKMVMSTPKFSWLSEGSRLWRSNVQLLANYVVHTDDYYDISERFGNRWAFHLRDSITNIREILRLDDIPY